VRIALAKPLVVHGKKSLFDQPSSPDVMADELAYKVMIACEPALVQLGPLFTTDFDPRWTEYEQIVNANWLALRSCFANKFLDLNKALGDQNYFKLHVDQLMERLADLDRIIELNSILDRATAKKEGLASEAKRLDSPLKAISILLRMRKFRPLWTYKPETY